MAVDWLKIRTEYVSTKTSMQKLADKYGASVSAIKRKAVAEGWTADRTKTEPKIYQKTVQKTVEKIATQEADRITRLLSIGDKLAQRLDQAADQLDQTVAKHKHKTRTVEYTDPSARGKPTKEVTVEEEVLEAMPAPIDRLGLQQLSAALKNLRDVAQTDKADETALSKIDKLIEGITDAAKP